MALKTGESFFSFSAFISSSSSLHSFFTMKAYLPKFRIEKLLLDSAHNAYAVYEYCRRENVTPFIDLNPGHFTYKDNFTIDEDGVPVCKLGLRMYKDGCEAAKHRAKYRCPKANRKHGCFCEHPCSPTKYGRHRSTKMWYCRLYGIMMLQHLDAWEMPLAEIFQESLLGSDT